MLGFTNEQIYRYSRHIILPDIGGKGQRKLLESSVLLIGAGGLGSPAAMYLAAAGVGTLGLVDFDSVDFSNLQRQLLHGTDDVGRSKIASATETIHRINPDVEVRGHETAITSANVMDIIAPYDVVLNGSDNFPTRYLINDACVLAGKPLVDGSIFMFEGQATVYKTDDGALLPLPLSHTASPRGGAQLSGSRRARRLAWHHRQYPGRGGDQAPGRHW